MSSFYSPFLIYDLKKYLKEYGKPKEGFIYRTLYRAHIRTRCGESQQWRCCYCSREMSLDTGKPTSLTLEHIIPRCEGGEDTYENCVAASVCWQMVMIFTNGLTH